MLVGPSFSFHVGVAQLLAPPPACVGESHAKAVCSMYRELIKDVTQEGGQGLDVSGLNPT